MRKIHDQLIENAQQIALQQSLLSFKLAQKEYDRVLQQGISKVNEQFNHKLRQQQSSRKIKRSSLINHYRMLKAQTKSKMCGEIYKSVQKKISQRIRLNIHQYQFILIKLIVQGVIRMFQQNCTIKCLAQDYQIVQEIIEDCITTYNYIMEEQIGRQYNLSLQIQKKDPLIQRKIQKKILLEKKDQNNQCFGGIILSDSTGNIVYKNTLDARVNILKEISLPKIRSMIWG